MINTFIDPGVQHFQHVETAVMIYNKWVLVLAETKSQYLVSLCGENKYIAKNSVQKVRRVT